MYHILPHFSLIKTYIQSYDIFHSAKCGHHHFTLSLYEHTMESFYPRSNIWYVHLGKLSSGKPTSATGILSSLPHLSKNALKLIFQNNIQFQTTLTNFFNSFCILCKQGFLSVKTNRWNNPLCSPPHMKCLLLKTAQRGRSTGN